MIKITINTENAAFDDDNWGLEVGRILGDLSNNFQNGMYPSVLRDINGNKVGTVEVDEK